MNSILKVLFKFSMISMKISQLKVRFLKGANNLKLGFEFAKVGDSDKPIEPDNL